MSFGIFTALFRNVKLLQSSRFPGKVVWKNCVNFCHSLENIWKKKIPIFPSTTHTGEEPPWNRTTSLKFSLHLEQHFDTTWVAREKSEDHFCLLLFDIFCIIFQLKDCVHNSRIVSLNEQKGEWISCWLLRSGKNVRAKILGPYLLCDPLMCWHQVKQHPV